MAEKKTTVHIDEEIWQQVEDLAQQNHWPNKAIVAAALLAMCELSEDQQWQAYRRLAEFRRSLFEKKRGPAKKK